MYYCVFVCICRVYSCVFNKYTSHSFVYDIHFSLLNKSECCDFIIDNRYYAPIFLLKEKCITRKTTLNNLIGGGLREVVLLNMHPGYCKWFFIPYNGSLLIILINFDLTIWKIEDGKQNINNSTGQLIGCKFEKIYQWNGSISE